jgi:hypothetical protein
MRANTVINKTYELVSRLPAQTVSERIQALLSKEGVEYRAGDLSVMSVKTPIAVVGIQPKLYSHSNFVGLNPFTFVSGIEVECGQDDREFTKVTLRINRLRGVLWVLFWITCSFIAARAMPQPGGVLLVIGVASATWFGIVSFWGGYLIKKEITDNLKETTDAANTRTS